MNKSSPVLPFFRDCAKEESEFDNAIPFPLGFEPNQEVDVLCGRGSDCFNSRGNVKFRELVQQHAEMYSNALAKSERSGIVSTVIHIIRKRGGNFIRFSAGRWSTVPNSAVREKVGATFRDCLSFKYRSAAKVKNARRLLKKKQERLAAKRKLQDAKECCTSSEGDANETGGADAASVSGSAVSANERANKSFDDSKRSVGGDSQDSVATEMSESRVATRGTQLAGADVPKSNEDLAPAAPHLALLAGAAAIRLQPTSLNGRAVFEPASPCAADFVSSGTTSVPVTPGSAESLVAAQRAARLEFMAAARTEALVNEILAIRNANRVLARQHQLLDSLRLSNSLSLPPTASKKQNQDALQAQLLLANRVCPAPLTQYVVLEPLVYYDALKGTTKSPAA